MGPIGSPAAAEEVAQPLTTGFASFIAPLLRWTSQRSVDRPMILGKWPNVVPIPMQKITSNLRRPFHRGEVNKKLPLLSQKPLPNSQNRNEPSRRLSQMRSQNECYSKMRRKPYPIQRRIFEFFTLPPLPTIHYASPFAYGGTEKSRFGIIQLEYFCGI